MALNKAYLRNLSNEEFCNVVELRSLNSRPSKTTTYKDIAYLLSCAIDRLVQTKNKEGNHARLK